MFCKTAVGNTAVALRSSTPHAPPAIGTRPLSRRAAGPGNVHSGPRWVRCQARLGGGLPPLEFEEVDLADFMQFRSLDQMFQREFERLDQQMDWMQSRLRQLDAENQKEGWVVLGDGARAYRHERSDEQRIGGLNLKSYHSECYVYIGGDPMIGAYSQPQAIASPFVSVAIALAFIWAWVSSLILGNYHLTTLRDDAKWRVSLGWPFLAAMSHNFRQQLGRIIRGQTQKDVEQQKMRSDKGLPPSIG